MKLNRANVMKAKPETYLMLAALELILGGFLVGFAVVGYPPMSFPRLFFGLVGIAGLVWGFVGLKLFYVRTWWEVKANA